VIARGDHMIFLQDPVSAGLLIVAVLFVLGSLVRNWYGTRQAEAKRSKA
jgi:TctA family transporter